jgi:hypothetical protein
MLELQEKREEERCNFRNERDREKKGCRWAERGQ